jgi:hypothetical protein
MNNQISCMIRNLLTKAHIPYVKSGPSLIAGRGVFASTNIEPNHVVALYPGIYTPPHPHLFLKNSISDDYFYSDEELVLLTSNTTGSFVSPSGRDVEQNAYILNLSMIGGYLDGACLTGVKNRRPLDINPSACGHLINHSATLANVEFQCFRWSDIVPEFDDDIDYDSHELMYDLPNERRQDGSPWYIDGDRLVRFPNADETIPRNLHAVGGAAFVTTRRIAVGEELLLNYRLRKPYPGWAKDWYVS